MGHISKDKPPSSSGNLLLIGLLSFGQKSALERLFDEGLGVSNALWQCLDAGIVFQIGTSLMKDLDMNKNLYKKNNERYFLHEDESRCGDFHLTTAN